MKSPWSPRIYYEVASALAYLKEGPLSGSWAESQLNLPNRDLAIYFVGAVYTISV